MHISDNDVSRRWNEQLLDFYTGRNEIFHKIAVMTNKLWEKCFLKWKCQGRGGRMLQTVIGPENKKMARIGVPFTEQNATDC